MTYQELTDRLTKCESTIENFKNGSYNSLPSTKAKQQLKKLTVLKESLQKQLLEANKKTYLVTPKSGETSALSLDDKEVDALEDADDIEGIKGADGAEVKEMTDDEFTDAQQATRLDKHPESEMIKKIQALIAGEKSSQNEAEEDSHINTSEKLQAIIANDKSNEDTIKEAPEGVHYIKVEITELMEALGILEMAFGDTRINFELNDPDTIYIHGADNGDMHDAVEELQQRGIIIDETSIDDELQEADINDPVLMKMRAAKTKASQANHSDTKFAVGRKNNIQRDAKIKDLEAKRVLVLRNMEQEAEPEGGPIADKYGSVLNKIDQVLHKLRGTKNEDAEEDTHTMPDGTVMPGKDHTELEEEGDLDVGHQDDEPNMLKSSAMETAEYAAKLYKKLDKYDQHDGEVDFPNWWQKKLILAREYMSAAYHYLDSEEKQPALDQLALESVVKEGRGDMERIVDLISDKAAESGLSPKEEAMEVMEAIGEYYEISFEYGRISEDVDENVDKVAGGYPYRVEGNKAIITEPMDDSTKESMIHRAKSAGYHAAPNMAGGITITLKKGTYEEINEDAGRDFDEIFGALGYRQGFDEFIEDNPGAAEVLHNWIGSINTFRETLSQEYDKDELERMGFYDMDDNFDESKQHPSKGYRGGAKKIQKAHDLVVSLMKDLAKKYRAGDKSVVDQLKTLTITKKKLEKQLDQAVANTNTGQDLDISEAQSTCCGKCGRKHVKGPKCKTPYLKGKDHCRTK
jgi:hypothetical protein